jgi:hypothetical protein
MISRSSNATIEVRIKFEKTVKKLTPQVLLKTIAPIPMPLPCIGSCNYLPEGMKYPLTAGQEVAFTLSHFVPKWLPNIRAQDMEFSVVDENKTVVMCFKMKGGIK